MFKIVLSAAALLAHGFAAKIECDVTAFDRASANLFLYGRGAPIYNDTAEAIDICASEKQSLDYIDYYVEECIVDEYSRGVLTLLSEAAREQVDSVCTDDFMRSEYAKVAPCLHLIAGRGILHCNRDFSAILEGIAAQPENSRIDLACCYIDKYMGCFGEKASKCNKRSASFAKMIVKWRFEVVLKSMCPAYDPKECRFMEKVTPVVAPKYKSIFAAISDALRLP